MLFKSQVKSLRNYSIHIIKNNDDIYSFRKFSQTEVQTI